MIISRIERILFQHTAARRRLDTGRNTLSRRTLFQHTAARRRLGPKRCKFAVICRFNTQPPEGGWFAALVEAVSTGVFQHAAARRRLAGGALLDS